MGALTRDIFVRNAYRTLGLSGSATQAAVDAAARRMRIWPDPSRIPPTPWDLPAWGAVPRTRPDIEHAVARLHEPRSRVEERFRWYIGPSPVATGEAPAAVEYDAAVAALHAAAGHDEFDAARWGEAAAKLQALAESSAWADAHAAIEAEGDFEKRAEAHEVRAAAAALNADVAATVGTQAKRALEAGDVAAFDKVKGALAGLDAASRAELANSIEDTLEVRRREDDAALRDKLRTRADAPWQFYEANRLATVKAAAAFERQFPPLLDGLAMIVPDDADRLLRARSGAARYLILIALGWEWSNRWRDAEEALDRALALGAGSVVEMQARAELERVRPGAEKERQEAKNVVEFHRRALEEGAAAAAGTTIHVGTPTGTIGPPIRAKFSGSEKVAQGTPKRRRKSSLARALGGVFAGAVLVVAIHATLTIKPWENQWSVPPKVDVDQFLSHLQSVTPKPAVGDGENAPFDQLRRSVESKFPARATTLPAEDVGESIREP